MPEKIALFLLSLDVLAYGLEHFGQSAPMVADDTGEKSEPVTVSLGATS